MSVDRDALHELIKNVMGCSSRVADTYMPIAEGAYHMALEDVGTWDDEGIYEEGYDDGYGEGYSFGYEAGLNNHAGDYAIQSARKVSPDV